MSKFRGMAAAAALLLLAPQVASAQDADDGDKYNFFSQPGASRAQVIADFEECRDLASPVQPPRPGYVYTPNVAAAAAAGLVQGFIRGAQRRHMFDAALRKCMAVKGYARYAMTKEEAKTLYDGSWPQLRERLADRAIAPTDGLTRLNP